jgi:hypothetical protein
LVLTNTSACTPPDDRGQLIPFILSYNSPLLLITAHVQPLHVTLTTVTALHQWAGEVILISIVMLHIPWIGFHIRQSTVIGYLRRFTGKTYAKM